MRQQHQVPRRANTLCCHLGSSLCRPVSSQQGPSQSQSRESLLLIKRSSANHHCPYPGRRTQSSFDQIYHLGWHQGTQCYRFFTNSLDKSLRVPFRLICDDSAAGQHRPDAYLVTAHVEVRQHPQPHIRGSGGKPVVDRPCRGLQSLPCMHDHRRCPCGATGSESYLSCFELRAAPGQRVAGVLQNLPRSPLSGRFNRHPRQTLQ